MKVKNLQATHPDYDGDRLRRLRALKSGGPAWHRLKKHWFPRRPVEPADLYEERLKLLRYDNHVGTIVAMLAAMLFAEAPQTDGLVGGWWEDRLDDVDRRGTAWASWWEDRLVDALVGRYGWAWINLPARDPEAPAPANRADEEAAGHLDAYLVPILPEQVINWAEDETGRVTAVMVRGQLTRWRGPEQGTTTIWRWRYIDAKEIRTWEWKATPDKPEPTDDDDAEELELVQHQVGRLPVVRLELSDDLWAMHRLEDSAVAAMRARNEHSWALHQAANELLTITSKWGDEEPDLGHGHYMKLARDGDGADAAGYVAPSGIAFEYLAQDVQETRDQVFRTLQQMALAVDAEGAKKAESAAAKHADWRAAEVLLTALRRQVLDSMAEALAVLAQARGDQQSQPQVSGLDGWQSEDIETFLTAAAMAIDAREMSPTFRRAVAKREAERILADEVSPETLETIRREIDGADADLRVPPPPRRGALEGEE